MERALTGIYPLPDLVVVDGLFVPKCPCKAEAVIRGDQKVDAVMAASILAKTERDLVESKKNGESEFERHSIIVFQEDLENFLSGFNQAVEFIRERKS